MIELTMLPARDGDCLLLRYGDGADLRTVLIDAGRAATYPKIKPVLAALEPPRIDLLVVTHVDQDHVLGVLKLLDDAHHVAVGRWFNGYDHLLDVTLETFGARDGERLTTLLLDQRLPWNATVGRAPSKWAALCRRPRSARGSTSSPRTGGCSSGWCRCGEDAASTG